MLSQGEYSYSTLCHTQFDAVPALLKSFVSCSMFAADIVECAIVENGVDDQAIGCARRVVLRGSEFPLRETLIGQRFSETRCVVTSQLTHAYHNEASTETCPASAAVNMITTLSVHRLTDEPLKCFVEFYATFDAVESSIPLVTSFLTNCWGRRLVQSLANYALKVEFPNFTASRPPRWTEFEDAVVQHVAKLPDPRLEALLEAYYATHAAIETETQKVLHLRGEVQARDIQLASSAATCARLQEDNQRLEMKAMLASHQSTQLPPTSDGLACATVQAVAAVEEEAPPTPAAVEPVAPVRAAPKQSCIADVVDAESQKAFRAVDVYDRGFITPDQLAVVLQKMDNCTDIDVALRTRGKTTSREEMYKMQARSWALQHAKDKANLTITPEEYAVFLLQAKRW